MQMVLAGTFALAMLAPVCSVAATIKSGAPACLTTEQLDRFVQALARNDGKTQKELQDAGCSILDHYVAGDILLMAADKVQIQVTPSIVFWVPVAYLLYPPPPAVTAAPASVQPRSS